MANFKTSSNLFIGLQELNRFKKFLDDDGFRKLFLKNSIEFGLFANYIEGNFDNGQISQGTNIGSIKNNELFAINNEGNIIYRPATDNISIANDSQWRWLKISHTYSPNEQFLVSIDKQGNLVCPDGDLTEILRGQPNNPTRISFPNSTLNLFEYDVVELIDEHNALLAGDFLSESNLQIAIVGTFTPGISVPSDDKYPYQYDSCTLTAIVESVLNTPPALIEGQEFLLARVKRTGSTITIQDKRSLNIYRDKADYENNNISISDNALIGVESIKFDSTNTPRDKNLVQIAWAFRSSNWTMDSSANRVTLIAGNGGKFRTTSDFTNGDFDGWRLYTEDGAYYTVKQSSLSATQINLILDTLDVDKFANSSQQLLVAPNAEAIDIVFTGNSQDSDGIDLGNQKLSFPINQEFAVVPLTVFESPANYSVQYAYKNFKSYSELTSIPVDAVGYLNESSFDDNGVQISNSRTAYTTDITLQLAANSYSNVISGLTTGQVIGVEYVSIDTDTDPVTRFVVGTRKEVVVITNDDSIVVGDNESIDFGPVYNLTTNAYLDLRTDLPSTLRNGNSFVIQFRGTYNLGVFTFDIVQNYINSGDPGDLLYSITSDDLEQAANNNLIFVARFDGTNWFLFKHISQGTGFVSSTRTISTIAPLTGGGDLSANRTLAINDAVADGSTKGASAFNSNDFNSASGIISIDYVNGPPPRTRSIGAGSGLSGGGDLSADFIIDVNVDNSTLEINSDTLRIKDSGVTTSKLNSGVVDNTTLEIGGGNIHVKDGGITATKIASGQVVKSGDAVQLNSYCFDIGVWNMSSTPSVSVSLASIDALKIVSVNVMILNDTAAIVRANYSLADRYENNPNEQFHSGRIAEIFGSSPATIVLDRLGGGFFDSSNFDDATQNRGFITILYKP